MYRRPCYSALCLIAIHRTMSTCYLSTSCSCGDANARLPANAGVPYAGRKSQVRYISAYVHTCTDVPRARWRARLLFVAYWNAISVIEWCGDKSYATKKLAGDLSSGTAGVRERRRLKLDTSCFDCSIIAVRWLKKYVFLLLCFPPKNSSD